MHDFEIYYPDGHTPESPELDWPFLIKDKDLFYNSQGILEDPPCRITTPDTLKALLWTINAVFGIVYAFLGYRCLRAVGFLTGLFAGAIGVLILQEFNVTLLGKPSDSVLAIVVGLFGAVLGSTYVIASGLISACAGALVAGSAMAVCVATMPEYVFGEREIIAAISGGAIICAVATVCCFKYVTILTTSIVGTAMILGSIDYFLHNLETIDWIIFMKPNPAPPPCFGGILICTWPVAVIISIMVQCFLTAWGVDHRKRLYYYHHHHHHAHHHHQPHQFARCSSRGGGGGGGGPAAPCAAVGETREEARQRKFRYLYQVRTARGDIISQNFVSALQKRIQLGGADTPSERSIKTSSNERNTFRSDRTHFTTIPDSEMCDKIDIECGIG